MAALWLCELSHRVSVIPVGLQPYNCIQTSKSSCLFPMHPLQPEVISSQPSPPEKSPYPRIYPRTNTGSACPSFSTPWSLGWWSCREDPRSSQRRFNILFGIPDAVQPADLPQLQCLATQALPQHAPPAGKKLVSLVPVSVRVCKCPKSSTPTGLHPPSGALSGFRSLLCQTPVGGGKTLLSKCTPSSVSGPFLCGIPHELLHLLSCRNHD